MIAANLNVAWNYGGGAAAEQNVLTGGPDEVCVNFEGGYGFVPLATADAGRVGAFSGARDAIQAADVRVDDGHHVRAVEDSNAVAYFSALGGVEPGAIEDDVVPMFGAHQTADVGVRSRSPLNSNEADVISDNRARRAPRNHGGEQFGWSAGGLGKGRTAGEAGDSAPCWRDARAFRRKLGVGRVGSHRDVVLVVAFFRRQHGHIERGSGGQKQRVSALGAVDGGGQIGLGRDPNLFSSHRLSLTPAQ